jgi:hypothetical protein
LRTNLTLFRKEEIKLFICSNNYEPYTDILLTETLGPDWRKFFDLIILDARKPLFFRAEGPFYDPAYDSAIKRGLPGKKIIRRI